MFDTKCVNDEHDCNVVCMSSLNINDANDMQSHKLGEAMFDEYDMFSPPSFDENIYYDESMPPIYDDYEGGTYTGRNCNNVKFPLYVLKYLKLCLFYLPISCLLTKSLCIGSG